MKSGRSPAGRLLGKAAACAAAFLLLGFGTAQAHDFWLEAPKGTVAIEEATPLRARVGDHFEGELYARNPRHIVWFRAEGNHHKQDVGGTNGKNPAGELTWKKDDLVVVAYESKPTLLTLEAEKFNGYLDEEGLTAIKATRKKLGRLGEPGKELFSRCAKTVVRVGKGHDKGFDRRMGLTLEIIPKQDPSKLRTGETLEIQVLHLGKAIEHIEIDALCRGPKGDEKDVVTSTKVRTDKDGNAKIKIDRAGAWLLAGVHMHRAPAGSDANWRSWWASLTFHVTTRGG